MFNLFKSKQPVEQPRKVKFVLVEKETETLYGYFESHNDVMDRKIELEIRSDRQFKVINV